MAQPPHSIPACLPHTEVSVPYRLLPPTLRSLGTLWALCWAPLSACPLAQPGAHFTSHELAALAGLGPSGQGPYFTGILDDPHQPVLLPGCSLLSRLHPMGAVLLSSFVLRTTVYLCPNTWRALYFAWLHLEASGRNWFWKETEEKGGKDRKEKGGWGRKEPRKEEKKNMVS